MESPTKWYPLPGFPKIPALLVSARFTSSSYTLHVTDLANIWTEKLERKGILLRSLQENTSVDLSDADPEQWAVFMSKLKAAFDPTAPDHHHTRLSIASPSDSKHEDSLCLRITCELPKPLEALRWPINLVKCQPAALASELVLPLIQANHVHCRENEDLMSQLKEKDAVITKLLDKLSTMNIPLENIFNSLSAKHVTTRAVAEDKIKGLAPFNEAKWRLQRSIPNPKDPHSLLQSVFGGSGFISETDMDLAVSDTLNDWWTKLGPRFCEASKSENLTSHQKPKQDRADTISSTDADDEDFQVQATPPHIPSRPKGGNKRNETDESDDSEVPDSHPTLSHDKPRSRIGTLGSRKKALTENNSNSQSSRTLAADEDETASETEDEQETAPSQNTRQSRSRLGTIGRPRQSSPPKTEAATPKKPPNKADDETASGSDSGIDGPVKPQSSPSVAPTTPRKGGLGRIGGKSKSTVTPSQTPKKSTSGTASDDSASPKKQESRKLGAIGRKAHTESKRTHSDSPAELAEPETDEQKAERKRAELANELNRKSAVPARKKRKF